MSRAGRWAPSPRRPHSRPSSQGPPVQRLHRQHPCRRAWPATWPTPRYPSCPPSIRPNAIFPPGPGRLAPAPSAHGGTYFVCADISAVSELDEAAFCQWLVREHGVAAIPLSAFYGDGFDQRVVRFLTAGQHAARGTGSAAQTLRFVGSGPAARIMKHSRIQLRAFVPSPMPSSSSATPRRSSTPCAATVSACAFSLPSPKTIASSRGRCRNTSCPRAATGQLRHPHRPRL